MQFQEAILLSNLMLESQSGSNIINIEKGSKLFIIAMNLFGVYFQF